MAGDAPPQTMQLGALATPLDAFVQQAGGIRPLRKILIASNGLGAAKAIKSMRRWEALELGAKVLNFVAMGTPQDIEANAMYLQLADTFVEVPGGKNNFNYANVELILQTALAEGCEAVWPGWGHASENPLLPETLSKHGIVFLGPPANVMRALGDKVAANLLAQSANVASIPWSGQGLTLTDEQVQKIRHAKDQSADIIPDELFKQACCKTWQEAVHWGDKIGYPVMIKASEGGGGKGIRKCNSSEEIKTNYEACALEVLGSPIFIMKYSSGACHLEVQILGDLYGNVCALSGRDCSTQRRFQKIFEEGPPTVADPIIFHQMQLAAMRLTASIGYVGAGTIEYLYNIASKEYYFLELNPRLQVEHPVTECITGVNLPACQLQIGMGVPLHKIADIGRFYSRVPGAVTYAKGAELLASASPQAGPDDLANAGVRVEKIDFQVRVPITNHCIAARVTAENAEDGFLPCSGLIKKIEFAPTHDVWGYFSVQTPGAVHEFADSQFGHVFAIGATREHARKALILALTQMQIEGDIRHTVDVLSKMLKIDLFVQNKVHTAWLDGLIADKTIKRMLEYNYEAKEGALKSGLSSMNLGPTSPPTELNNVPSLENTANTASGDEMGRISQQLGGGGGGEDAVLVNDAASSDAGQSGMHGNNMRGAYPSQMSLHNFDRAASLANAEILGMGMADESLLLGCEDFVVYAAVAKAISKAKKNRKVIDDSLSRGQVVSMFSPVFSTSCEVCYNNTVYSFVVQRYSDESYVIRSRDDGSECIVHVKEHKEAMFIKTLYTKATKVVANVESLGVRLRIGAMMTQEIFLPNVQDPSELRSDVQGKFIRFLVEEGAQVEEGQVIAEMEAMKMIVPIKNRTSGKATKFYAQANAVVGIGDLLLKLELGAGAVSVKKWGTGDLAGKKLFPVDISGKIQQKACSVLAGYPRLSGGKNAVQISNSLDESALDIAKFLNDEEDFLAHGAQELESNEIVLHRYLSERDASEAERTTIVPIYEAFLRRAHLSQRIAVILEILTKFDNKLLVLHSETIGKLTKLPTRAYGELVLKSERLINENARNYIDLNQIQRGKEIIQKLQPTNLSVQLSDPQYDSVLTLRTLLTILGTADSSTKSEEQSKTLECLIERVYRGYEVAFSSSTPTAAAGAPGATIQKKWTYTFPGCLQNDSMVLPPTINNANSKRQGMCVLVQKSSSLAILLEEVPSMVDQIDELWIVYKDASVTDGKDADKEKIAAFCLATMNSVANLASKLKSVTLSFTSSGGSHFRFAVATGNKREWVEDSLMRDLRPTFAHLLELPAPTGDTGDKTGQTTRICPEIHAHAVVYIGAEALQVRCVAYESILSESSDFTAALQTAIDELARAKLDPRVVGSPGAKDLPAKIMINVMPQLTMDMDQLKANYQGVVLSSVSGFVAQLNAYRVDRIEFKIRLKSGENLRLMATSASEYLQPRAFLECMNPLTGEVERSTDLDRVIHKERSRSARTASGNPLRKSSSSGQRSSALGDDEGSPIEESQSSDDDLHNLSPRDGDKSWEVMGEEKKLATKRTTANKAGSTYVYDWPHLLKMSLLQMNTAGCNTGGLCFTETKDALKTFELLLCTFTTDGAGSTSVFDPKVQAANLSKSTSADKQKVFDLNAYTLRESSENGRGIGKNTVGMVAWRCELKTAEYPAGREIVLIANDITHQAGSFGVFEDIFYQKVSAYARAKGLPFVYVSSNSGARVGIVDKLVDKVWPNPTREWWYMKHAEYAEFKDDVVCSLVELEGEGQVYKLEAIKGGHGIGVENLKGSGLIAGETSRAYQETFTISYVTGRSVGIGAYINRLGQRIIQKRQGPMILTGFSALNKLLGSQVYTSQDQLGGPQVMCPNGVTHMLVENDHEGMEAILKWLSFVPAKQGDRLPLGITSRYECTGSKGDADGSVFDPSASCFIGKDVAAQFTPDPSGKTPYDPRVLLNALFDANSFVEVLADWGKTVCCGRARLCGIPLGVISVETRSVNRLVPADPANVDSKIQEEPQAGQVWFPDSAFKTATCIRDFSRESLPLMIFANWRGFSGGTRDMFSEILKYGAMIVDALVDYKEPVIIYMPPGAELRGGAWVVIDPAINPNYMEMYADGQSRGGILEPAGIVDVKLRKPLLLSMIERCEKNGATMGPAEKDKLLPAYTTLATEFADLHDRAPRMKEVGVVRDVVDWTEARKYFYWRLRRRILECDLQKQLAAKLGLDKDGDADKLEEAAKVFKGAMAHVGVDMSAKDEEVFKTLMSKEGEFISLIEKMAKQHQQQQVLSLFDGMSAKDKELLLMKLKAGETATAGSVGFLEGMASN